MNATNGNSQSKLHGLWALTNRELKKWYKAPVIFILSIIQPVLWMGLLGKAMNIGAIFSGSTRLGELIKSEMAIKTVDENYKITTFGLVQMHKEILPRIRAKIET